MLEKLYQIHGLKKKLGRCKESSEKYVWCVLVRGFSCITWTKA